MSLTENGNFAVRVDVPPDFPIRAPSSGVVILTDVSPYVLIVSTESTVSVYLKAAVGKADPSSKSPVTTKSSQWWRKADLEFLRLAFSETEHGVRFNAYSKNGPFKKKVFQNVSPHPNLFSFPANAHEEIFKAVEALRVKFNVPAVEGFDASSSGSRTLFDYLVNLAYPAKQFSEVRELRLPTVFERSSAWRQAMREHTVKGLLQSLLGKRKVTPRMVDAFQAGKVEGQNVVQAWALAQREPGQIVEGVFLGEDPRFGVLFNEGLVGSQVFARIISDSFLGELTDSKKTYLSRYSIQQVSDNISLYRKVPRRSINSYEELSGVVDAVKQEFAWPESLDEGFTDTVLVLEERGYETRVVWEKDDHSAGKIVFNPKCQTWTASISVNAIRSHNGVDRVGQTTSINLTWGDEEVEDNEWSSVKKRNVYLKSFVYDRYVASFPLAKRKAVGESKNLVLPPRHAALAFLLTVDDVRDQLARVRKNVSKEMLHKAYVSVARLNFPVSVRVYRNLARMISLGFSFETMYLLQRFKVPAAELVSAAALPEDLLGELYGSSSPDYSFF